MQSALLSWSGFGQFDGVLDLVVDVVHGPGSLASQPHVHYPAAHVCHILQSAQATRLSSTITELESRVATLDEARAGAITRMERAEAREAAAQETREIVVAENEKLRLDLKVRRTDALFRSAT